MKCESRGELQAGGRAVAMVRCELEAGHDKPRTITVPMRNGRPARVIDRISPTPHRFTLTWVEDDAPIDDDRDPGVNVPLDE